MSREDAIRAVHAALTVETLEALSNKGLLRRAQKDLERGEVGDIGPGGGGLTVSVGEQRVTLVEAGPAKAACTCPAPGVCQHILAACLHLLQQPALAVVLATPPGQRVKDEWLSFADEDLVAAFGLPDMRAAHELQREHEAEISADDALVVRFPSLNAEVRGVPGTGIAGIIVRGPSEKRHPQFAAAALLAVRTSAGHAWEPPAMRSDAATAAPLHRDPLLRAVAETLEEMVRTGLARLSPSVVERLDGLSVSAQTAGLHRLNLLLQRLASDARDWLHRRPHADLAQIFESMATGYALTHALLARPQAHLTGVAREAYADVGSLDLVGVTAWPWRTQSGYEGLTLLMWDQTSRTWATWSDARPLVSQGRAGFNAVARFTQPGPWEGVESPAQLARSRFRLIKARRNRWNRLSSSTQSRALVTAEARIDDLAAPVIQGWAHLDELLERATPPGLRERDPRAGYQIVQPAHWERHPFDPIGQCLSWTLHDGEGASLELHLPFDEHARLAIEQLERLDPRDLEGCRVVGRCHRWNRGLRIFPLALLTPVKAMGLFFANHATRPPAASGTEFLIQNGGDDVEEPEEASVEVSASSLGGILLAATSALEWMAETGTQSHSVEARSRLTELSKNLSQLGARRLSDLTSFVAESCDPAAIMKLRWMLLLSCRSLV